MTKYLASAALAAAIAVAAFAAPASAQVGIGINIGPDRPHYGERHYGDRHYRDRRPVRVYSGRNAYRNECETRRTVRWVNGRKVVRTVRACD